LIASGPRGLYRVEPPRKAGGSWRVTVTTGDLSAASVHIGEIASGWTIAGVVPTATDVFFRASAPGETTLALYRLVDGSLDFVRATDVGAASAVAPFGN
jgi:hypothetical protein